MISQTIRRNFLKFFKDNGHAVISSSSVVPHDDPSLLFTNAGMNQFKDVFLGKSQRDYSRATTSQKCIRVGGKHNDLDNVGHTTRHLTFFEMLGNFSFGDYFKSQAIEYAWKVSTQVFEIPEEKIWATIFEDDDESYELWKKILPTSRIVRLGEKDNFWAMGDTGPCGPCSELLFDRGDKYGSATNPKEDPSGERYFEFWNLVFMQYNRDAAGHFQNLPKQSIDTGAGLERVVSLKMNVDNVFSTDIFRSLIAQIENTMGVPYNPTDLVLAPAFHVIADHIRSLSFAIADGAQPSNTERGYVLRKILRRAVRYGKHLGVRDPFLAKILPRLIEVMGPDYPELIASESKIAEILTIEEESFFKTLRRGGNILSNVIEKASNSASKQISGEDAFKLKDTYGFPIEEVVLIAKDAGLQVNLDMYQILEEQAKEKSRAASTSTSEQAEQSIFEDFVKVHGKCEFNGYEATELDTSILAIFKDGKPVESLCEGEEGMIMTKNTPFYAEKGGQVGDSGIITHHKARFVVTDCKAPFPGVIAHVGKMEKGIFIPGEPVRASVNKQRRAKIENNHTATHLLHYALDKILGSHIKQAGSLVEENRLRFDFNHHKPLTKQEIQAVEDLVNEKIRENQAVKSYELKYEEVQNQKAIKQFFGDKYGASVRVIDIDYSKELCGGTHTKQVGNIGLFKIIKEGSVASGIRRIEALTGREAQDHLYNQEKILEACCLKLKTSPDLLEEKLQSILEENKVLSEQIKILKRQEIKSLAKTLKADAKKVKNVSFIASIVPFTVEEMQYLAEELSAKEENLFIALGTEIDKNKCQILVKITPDLQKKGLQAGAFVKQMAPLIEGAGGGKADSAQAGGKNPTGMFSAFETARNLIESLC